MSEYTDAVDAGLEGLDAPSVGVCESCEECPEYNEPSFSWTACGICRSYLGGNRYVWHWLSDDGELQHENDACTDCVMYMANGDEPEHEGGE